MNLSIETTSGIVHGKARRGIRTWRGIPYATAQRFRAPRRAPACDREATEFGPFAMQARDPRATMMSGVTSKTTTSEDCLVLNIYAPPTAQRCPVVVWIHGGAFIMGAGSQVPYDGTSFATLHDVVVVTINYRLGLFGLMYLGDVLGSSSGSSSGDDYAGNCALLDQVEALRWVRDNIAAFGGDPNAVTVMGESAGAVSVAHLLAMPAARGLFHRAILQSGAPGLVTRTRDEATQFARDVCAHLGIAPRDVVDVDAERLVQAQSHFTMARGLGAFTPYVDGKVVPHAPVELVREGSAAGVPILLGSNRDEWALFDVFFGPASTQAVVAQLRGYLGDVVDAMHAKYRAVHGQETGNDARAWVDMVGDLAFRLPMIKLAEAQVRHAPVYMYRFDWATSVFDGRLGAAHALELPFVWNAVDTQFAQMLLGADAHDTKSSLKELATRMHGTWAAFIRSGVPDSSWPTYDATRRATMLFDRDIRVVDDPAGELRAAWQLEPR